MSDNLQRLRRDLADATPNSVWPAGYALRTFVAEDAVAVHRLLELGYAQGGGEVGSFDEWWPGVRDDDEFAADLCFLVVDGEGAIVGVAQCWTSAFIKDLVVHPLARRRGVAEALLMTVFQTFRRRGASHVDLKVRKDNPTGASRLYKRVGMHEVAIDGPARP
jgi:ribosomal protein S18 acetylase RimI-like enzyme